MGSVSLKGVRIKVVALKIFFFFFSGHFKKENMDEHCNQLIMINHLCREFGDFSIYHLVV